MQNDEDKTDQKTASKRDEKGRFIEGCPGGPGRGNESDDPDDLDDLDFWQATEKMIRAGMQSTNDTTKNQAVNTYLKWKTMKDVYDEKSKSRGDGIYTPEVLELLKMRDLIPKLGGSEGVEKMLRDCPGCDKFPGRVFKFNIPPQKEKT